MTGFVLTQNNTFLFKWIVLLLGKIMEGIFWVIDKIGLPNIGLAIILFTIIIYMLLTPLTIKQQKFSKLSAKMNPEIQAIQKKYQGKKDNDSVMKMNEETQAIYHKYGVSPTGSCVQLLIQFPILLALYRVIMSMPAYVHQIKLAFSPLVDNLYTIYQTSSTEVLGFFEKLKNYAMYRSSFTSSAFQAGDPTAIKNAFIDVLNRSSTAEWHSVAEKFPSLANDVTNSLQHLERYNNFLGVNIANSPSYIMKEGIAAHAPFLIVAAIAFPVLAFFTQWLNTKLMPQPDSNGAQNPMGSSMKMMNILMPLMSAWFCYSLPAGLGLYWIMGAVVRSIQQVAINKHIDKMDIDAEIKKNQEKRRKKLEKKGIDPDKVNTYANMSTRNIAANKPSISNRADVNRGRSQEEREAAMRKATDYYSKNAKQGSIASKANMVKQYNEKNNTK